MLNPYGLLQVDCYVDAAFALHEDSESHRGMVVFARGVMVFAATWKQKCSWWP